MRLLASLALLACAAPLLAQTAPDSAACRALLAAPTPDTDIVRVEVLFNALPTAYQLPPAYSALLRDAFRQAYRPPRPLELSVYDAFRDGPPAAKLDPTRATLTLRGAYRAFLRRDGQIVNASVVGGAQSPALDASVLATLDSLNAQGGVAMIGDEQNAAPDSIELDIVVTPSTAWSTSKTPPPITAGSTPIFNYRTPVRRATARPRPVPGNLAPPFPPELRSRGIEGDVLARFIIKPDTHVDLNSVEILTATRSQFGVAVFSVLPGMRFHPMEVEGCAVPSYVNMPFQFRLTGG